MKRCLLCGNLVDHEEQIVTSEGLHSPCCGGPMLEEKQTKTETTAA